jgi:general stress protein 26
MALAEARGAAVAEFQRLVDGITVVMVTTVASDDLFRSRPMLLECVESDGSLTFLTHLSSQKVEELERDPRVNVAFVGERGDRYVSASGVGSTKRDGARIQQLWKPTYRAWFPGGAEDPDIAVLTIDVQRVEYWDVPSSRLVRLWGAMKALASGQPAEAGDHRTIELPADGAESPSRT